MFNEATDETLQCVVLQRQQRAKVIQDQNRRKPLIMPKLTGRQLQPRIFKRIGRASRFPQRKRSIRSFSHTTTFKNPAFLAFFLLIFITKPFIHILIIIGHTEFHEGFINRFKKLRFVHANVISVSFI